jgi:uncharacterized protein YqhQ
MKDIGGQAVIEGVMMKSGKVWSVAVRGPDKDIIIKKEEIRELPKVLKLPVLRGVVTLVQMLSIGIRAILFSAEKSGVEEETPSTLSLTLTVVVAFVLGIGLFLLLPLYGTKLLGILFASIEESSILFNFVDGVIRVAFFLIYIFCINLSKDIKRVFQYHGAEHKTVHAYEAGVELTPENVENYTSLHPRCGTSFLIIVMALSIMIFSFIPNDWPFLDKFLSRVVLIPLVAGLSYEFVKFSSKKLHNPLIRTLAAPGLWLQKLTTGTPSRDQLEVAISAIKEVLRSDSGEKEINVVR